MTQISSPSQKPAEKMQTRQRKNKLPLRCNNSFISRLSVKTACSLCLVTYNSQFCNEHQSEAQWESYEVVANKISHSRYPLFARAREDARAHTLGRRGK